MAEKVILAVDQSTQGTKAVVFGRSGDKLGTAQKNHAQLHPQPGWVEHDPEEILRNTAAVLNGAVENAGAGWSEVTAIGITNQRETVVAWDRGSGRPVCNALVWQDGRAESLCTPLQARAEEIREITGLTLSPFFSAPKMAWILRNVPEAAALAARGRLCFGTIDSFLLFRLTGGVFRTDMTNASRTMLMDLRKLCWSPEMCALFGIPMDCLPEIVPSDGADAVTRNCPGLPDGVPIASMIGDSHGALYGNLCTEPGQAKVTYGTGSSIMMNSGSAPVFSSHGLVSSVAYAAGGRVCWCLEGNLNTTGANISWLKTLGILADAKDSGRLAQAADPRSRVCFVPALQGLAAPWWRTDIRASFVNMDSSTGRAELVRAVEDSIAFSIGEVCQAMEEDTGAGLCGICADGGAVRDRYLMQLQADTVQAEVRTGSIEEISARGAAFLAGLKTGFYLSEDALRGALAGGEYFSPGQPPERRSAWRAAVEAALR